MKFAKKILVGLLSATLLVSSIALSSSAQTPERNPEYYESIFEYKGYEHYYTEDFQNYNLETEADYSNKELGDLKFHGAATVVDLSGNQLLKIPATADASGAFRWVKETDYPKSVVTSFTAKFGDTDQNNGAKLSVVATFNNFVDQVTLFTIDATDAANANISYASFDERYVVFNNVNASEKLAVGTSYDVTLILNGITGEFEISISSDTTEVFSATVPAPVFDAENGVDSLRFSVDNGAKTTETLTYLDNFKIYEGTFVRDTAAPDAALADVLIEMDEYANDLARTVDERLAMANLYSRFFPTYVVDSSIEEGKRDAVTAIKNGAEGYINKASAKAFIEYAANIMNQADYYAQLKYQTNVVKPLYDKFATVDGVAGMDDSYEGTDVKYSVKVAEAKAIYDAATVKLENVSVRSALFAQQIEETYSPNNQDYVYMVERYNHFTTLRADVAPSYKYQQESNGNPDSDFETVADAIAVYDELKAKIDSIDAAVANFIPKVNALEIVESTTFSETEPYLTANFPQLYQNYLAASALYHSETGVHEQLDESTYPGFATILAEYYDYEDYILERVAACNDFVSLVNGVANSGLYATKLQRLDDAMKYLDANKEYALEKHTGVEEAMALYKTLRQSVADDLVNAGKYKEAVAAINIEASYTELRAKVDAALALKDAGDIIGIEGVKEANLVFISAQEKLSILESNSAALNDCIAKLKDAKTLAERRKLIITANSVKDKAEPTIAGVTAAKAELASYIESYNADIAAANEMAFGVVTGVAEVSAASTPSTGLYRMLEVIKALFK